MAQPLSPLGALVRRHDPARFLTALFASPARRETLFALYAFNHELARAREVASEPMLALIRLQWWREVAEGARRRHDVAGPLGEALDAGALPAAALGAMIAAREAEAEPAMPSLAAWRAYVDGTAGALAEAAGHALGAPEAVLPRLRALGAAYGVAGQLRNIAALASQQRCLLPEDVLAAHGLTTHQVVAAPATAALAPVRAALAAEGLRFLETGRGRFPRQAIAAALPGVLARRDLARPHAPPAPRALGDQMAVLRAALRARV